MGYYNVSEMVIESMLQSGNTGFITMDYQGRYLGSNDIARRILPELCQISADQPIWNGKGAAGHGGRLA